MTALVLTFGYSGVMVASAITALICGEAKRRKKFLDESAGI